MSVSEYHLQELEIARSVDDPRRVMPEIPPGCTRILDAGCGIGQTLIASNLQKGGTYVGIDIDASAIEIGRSLTGQVCFVQATGEQLPFCDSSFDLVVCRVALPYMHISTALAEFRRVLAANGRIWLVLHPYAQVAKKFLRSVCRLNPGEIFDSAYVLADGWLFNATGRQIRHPGGGYECYQTAGGMRKALGSAGFGEIRIQESPHFTATARKISQTTRVVSLSTVYPTAEQPGRGLFIRARLQHIARVTEVKVIAPVPVFDYGGKRLGRHRTKASRWDGDIEVLHPRWAYPPLGGVFNAACLYAFSLLPLMRLRRRFRFQVLDAHFAFPEGIAGALLAGTLHIPFTVTMRGCELVHSRYRFRRMCMGWALRKAARVIAVSSELRQLAVRLGVEPSRAVVIPNGVDADLYCMRDREECRARHSVPPGNKLVFSAGHLVKGKRFDRLVRALRTLDANVHVWIAGGPGGGGPSAEPELLNLARTLGVGNRFRLLGWVPPQQIAELMVAADVFCLPSNREGWPNVVHEALSCGTPVVATNVGAVSDLIPSERYGVVVPVDDQAALEAALAAALRRTTWDRNSISQWGRSRSWTEAAIATRDEFEKIAANA